MSKEDINTLSNLIIEPNPNNPNNYFRFHRLTTAQRDAIPKDGLRSGTVIYNTDTNFFNFYAFEPVLGGPNWFEQAPPIFKQLVHAYVGTSYAIDVDADDHVKFDTEAFNISNTTPPNISLDTTTAYTAAANVDSIGRFTLLPGRNYKLTASLNHVLAKTGPPATLVTMQWFNANTNTALTDGFVGTGYLGSEEIAYSGVGVLAYFQPLIETRVELRLINDVNQISGNETGLGSIFCVVESI